MKKKIKGGLIINDRFENHIDTIGTFPLIVADPPYGDIVKADWDKGMTADIHLNWLSRLERAAEHGTSLYWFGGWGKYKQRILFETLARAEHETNWHLQALIPWVKKRAYGVKDNYLAALELIGYFTLGPKPAIFKKPYLDELRTCNEWGNKDKDGKSYKCHDKRKRRTMFWGDFGEVVDVSEIFRKKVHDAEKPVRVYEIPIETHTNPGDRVLDPFGGSGVSIAACRKLEREFVVIEKDKQMCERMIENR